MPLHFVHQHDLHSPFCIGIWYDAFASLCLLIEANVSSLEFETPSLENDLEIFCLFSLLVLYRTSAYQSQKIPNTHRLFLIRNCGNPYPVRNEVTVRLVRKLGFRDVLHPQIDRSFSVYCLSLLYLKSKFYSKHYNINTSSGEYRIPTGTLTIPSGGYR